MHQACGGVRVLHATLRNVEIILQLVEIHIRMAGQRLQHEPAFHQSDTHFIEQF